MGDTDTDIDADTPAVTASLTQVLRGIRIAGGEAIQCLACEQPLRDGAAVGGFACRCADDDTWRLCRVYCGTCRPDGVQVTTLGVAEAVVYGRLGVVSDGATQRTWVTLLEPVCVDFAGADTESQG